MNREREGGDEEVRRADNKNEIHNSKWPRGETVWKGKSTHARQSKQSERGNRVKNIEREKNEWERGD